MRKFKYTQPGPNNKEIETILTEDEVIAICWEFWCEKMRSIGKAHLISRERCIEDFVAVHWAEEIT